MKSDSVHSDAKPEAAGNAGRSGKRKWLLLTLGLLLTAGYAAWSIIRPAYLAAKGARLIELKNLAIAYLENESDDAIEGTAVDGYVEADRRLLELTEQAPEELAGWRNLAISRLLAYELAKPEQKQFAAAKAKEAIDWLLAADGDSATTHWLAAKLELSDNGGVTNQQAIDSLVRACELDQQNAIAHFSLFWITHTLSNQQWVDQGRAALKQAYELMPDNLIVLTNWLVVQARLKDESILATIDRAAPLIAAIQPMTPGGIDLMQFLATARQAAAQDDWDTAYLELSYLRNVVPTLEAGRSEQKRVFPHPLELIVHDFSPAFYDKYRPGGPQPAPAIDVRFEPWPERQLPELTDARDVAAADVDLDGSLDLLVLHDSRLTVFRRNADGYWQADIQHDVDGAFRGLLVADLDRDGVGGTPTYFQSDVDVMLYGEGGIRVLRNQLDEESGRRRFDVVPQMAELANLKNVAAAVLVDFDHDSDLDLVASSDAGVTVWLNRGNQTFVNVSDHSILPPVGSPPTSLSAVDFDRDVDIDVVLGGGPGQLLGYLENLRHGNFRWVPLAELPTFTSSEATDTVVLESDGNASWDLVYCGGEGIRQLQTVTPSPGVVRQLRDRQVDEKPATGLLTLDFDNDGFQDVLAWNEYGLWLLRGGRDGQFEKASAALGELAGVRFCRAADLDDDGDLDLIVAAGDALVLYRNEGGNANHWLTIEAMGREDSEKRSGRVNENGIGSLIELRSGQRYQAQVVTGQRTHFGMGQNEKADTARITWTSGIPQNIIAPQARTTVFEPMFLKGSCPYVYTWNGERFEFFTDLLWASPIGLQFAEGVMAPSRPWEYLKIPGDKLRAKDGMYDLQITEELWEAAYFDQVQLLAVDHPADVEIYSNEKVGPAAIAEYKIHTVRQRRDPVAARDKHGRDVLQKVHTGDGDYFQGFDARVIQGLTDEHFLELDFGDLDNARKITLFLTGWIHPTDTSLNIHLSQNPDLDAPRPPSVWAPDADGQWQETIRFMGFPGGKTKTIAVDLSNAFLTGDYRIRIRTTAEIYWDEAFFTIDEAPVEMNVTPLSIASADLHYRGFSARLSEPPRAPQQYDYSRVTTQSAWPPMGGRFTRYGEVAELLTKADDRQVVMGSGDEMTVCFTAPPAPPTGWKRDFLLHNVGWDKDADMNTVSGQTVEPLPFQAMPSYPYGPAQSYPDTPAHRAYLREFQTREQNPASFWKQLQ